MAVLPLSSWNGLVQDMSQERARRSTHDQYSPTTHASFLTWKSTFAPRFSVSNASSSRLKVLRPRRSSSSNRGRSLPRSACSGERPRAAGVLPNHCPRDSAGAYDLLPAHFGKAGKLETVLPKCSQNMLADMVGTTRSRVSFVLSRFRKRGFIDYNGWLHVHFSLLLSILHE